MPCHDCRAPKKLSECMVHAQKGAAICHQCCISKHHGLHCPWNDLCWHR